MNMLTVLRTLGPIDWRNVRRDSLLRWMMVMPVVIALLLRLLIPWLTEALLIQFAFDLAPYRILFVSYALLTGTPVMFGVIIGFLLLDERDDRTLTALQVTPLSLNQYLAYRIGLPMGLSVVMMLLSFPLAGLVQFPLRYVLLVALLAAPLAPLFALVLAAVSTNKVQGFAITKGVGSLFIIPLIAYFVPLPWQWLFGLVPTFWPPKLYWLLDAGEPGAWLIFAVGMAYQLALLVLLVDRFDQVMHRE